MSSGPSTASIYSRSLIFITICPLATEGIVVAVTIICPSAVMTVTIPTPICPILTCLCPSRVVRITPEHPTLLPNPLAPSQANSHLSNALPNTLTPLCLVDALPTRCSFDLSSSLRQVNSRHPHSFLTRRSFDLSSSLRQVDSRHPHSFPTRCHSTFSVLASSPFPTSVNPGKFHSGHSGHRSHREVIVFS